MPSGGGRRPSRPLPAQKGAEVSNLGGGSGLAHCRGSLTRRSAAAPAEPGQSLGARVCEASRSGAGAAPLVPPRLRVVWRRRTDGA